MMDADHDEVPRTLNCAALRSLHELLRKLRRQIDELRAIDCEVLEAADALVFAIAAAERACDNARETQRRLLRDEMPADRVVG